MKRMVPERLRTFSVTFESAEFDESAFQDEMVRHLGTAHSRIACTTSDIAQDFPAHNRARRTSDPAHRTDAAPDAVEADARQRLQGRADRRRRRRGVRRLRHLQGSKAPSLLRATAEFAAPSSACCDGFIRISPACSGSRRAIWRASSPRAQATLPIRCSRICRVSARRPAPRRSIRQNFARRSRITTPSPSCATAFRRSSRAGIRCRRRSISNARISCRATSCPRRAIAWRWRTRSKAASRSSTIGWSSSPPAFHRS